jgi:uncharacterized protein (DUF58 family)
VSSPADRPRAPKGGALQALRSDRDRLAERVASLQMEAQRLAAGVISGLHASPFRGGSAEFAEYKEYAPGDDPRTIDWKSVARSDRWFVKRFEETTNRRCFLLLDASESMAFARGGRRPKIDMARLVLAGLSTLLLGQGDAVGAAVVGGSATLRSLPARSRTTHREAVLTLLAGAEAGGALTLAQALDAQSAGIPARSLVVIASDLVDDPEAVAAALRRLAARGHETLVIHVLDDEEVGFHFTGQIRFVDPETRQEVLADAAAVAEGYRAQVREFLAGAERAATSARGELVRLLTGDDPAPILLRFLARRRAQARRGGRIG